MGRQIQKFVDDEAKVESERLASMRGPFPEWERSIWGPDASCARDPEGERIRPMRRLRNCNVTTVAPTGTISHHRRLQLGHRAALRGGVHAEPGRRADAGCQRGLRGHRPGGGVVLRGADAADRRGGHIDFEEVPAQVAAGVRHRQPDQARVAHPDAGRLPGVQRLAPSPRPATSRTTPPRRTSRRSTGWPSSSTARVSRSIATAAATCRCSRPAPPPRRSRSRR